MGGRTPPKRPEERLGHPKRSERGGAPSAHASRDAHVPATDAHASGLHWPGADRTWLARTKTWYRSLQESGQAAHYQPSDVAHAMVMAGVLDDAIRWHDAALYRLWLAGTKGLMVTELDRRLGRMELAGRRPSSSAGSSTSPTSPTAPSTASVVDELAAARARIGG
jgi:hypothetical protein